MVREHGVLIFCSKYSIVSSNWKKKNQKQAVQGCYLEKKKKIPEEISKRFKSNCLQETEMQVGA